MKQYADCFDYIVVGAGTAGCVLASPHCRRDDRAKARPKGLSGRQCAFLLRSPGQCATIKTHRGMFEIKVRRFRR
jgi:hypothetical protein